MSRESTELKCKEYNDLIDNVIKSLKSLKITTNYTELKVTELYNMGENFSVINNAKNRRKISVALQNVILEFGRQLQEEVNDMKEKC